MRGLKCTTLNCEHNILNNCNAGIINVTEKAVCSTKIKRDGGILAQSFHDMEAGADLEALSSQEVFIQCDAECVYNENYKCSKDNVLIEDSVIRTKCFSRKKPN